MKFFDLLKSKKYYNCALFVFYAILFCLSVWLCFYLVSSSIADSKYATKDQVHTTTPFKTITVPTAVKQTDSTAVPTTSQAETTEITAPKVNEKTYGDFVYKVDELGVSIVGFKGRKSEIKIPSAIKEISVVKIKGGVFKNNAYVKKIIVPSTVQEIGDEAFYSCENLETVVLSDGLINIGDGAFSCCVALKSVTIPNSVTNIGLRAFEHCVSAEKVELSNSITSINAATFSNCKKLKEFMIPSGVTKIGYDAFFNCKMLKQVTIPETVTQIDKTAFLGCDSLEFN